ncbi:bone morphogenetic protein 7-like isoform X1 [Cotesia glomerata]|nr:bone morphogenetic protein 7-like isoform X1 [Cotesia glomerata]
MDFYKFLKDDNMINFKPSKKETRSGPSYLMSAYSQTIDKILDMNFINYQLTPQELMKINNSDTVASFLAKKLHKSHKKNKVTQAMIFDAEVIQDQPLMKADLRLFRDKSRIFDSYRVWRFNLTVYMADSSGERKKYFYVDSKMVDPEFEGWIVFNVTESFQKWRKHDESNDGFRIIGRIKKNYFKKYIAVNPDFLGIVGLDGDPDKHPFALGHYHGLVDSFLDFDYQYLYQKRLSREANIHDYDYEEMYVDFNSLGVYDKMIYPGKRSRCKIREVNLNFKDISMEFIVAPVEIPLNDCLGQCSYPFDQRANATDHAILKSRESIYEVSRLQKPGCTPIKYEDRTLLYYFSDSVFIKRAFKNMTAIECGCR